MTVTIPAGLAAAARAGLGTLPTPLQPAPALSDALGVEIWLKRDDLTGFGLGGNKVRTLDYLLADPAAARADSVVTGAGPQSNWAALAALAARYRGLDAVLCLYGDPAPEQGNLRLMRRAGADLRFTGDPDRASVDRCIEATALELRARGHHPLVLPRGGALPRGCLGYLRAAFELDAQLAEAGLAPAELWLATGSCGTQAGLLAGAVALRALGAGAAALRVADAGTPWRVVGVTVSRPQAECRTRVLDLARGAAELACTPPPAEDDVTVLDGWAAPGYGLPSPAGEAAADLVARRAGVLLDPVFGAKAMAALADACRSGAVAGPVVFLVSGGAATLFADLGGGGGGT